jgi:TatD DNase family protein
MMLVDSHAHLDIKKGDGGPAAEAMLDRAFRAGLTGIVAVAGATAPGEYQESLAIASRYPAVVVAAGIHPHAAHAVTPAQLEVLRSVLRNRSVVALGETGLDYHYNFSEPKEQRRAFTAQIRLAREAGIPIVIHTREADADTLAILRDEGADQTGGVIHCFSSGPGFAQAALDLGLYVSFSGIITFPKADGIRDVAKGIPEARILAETDTPFLSPVPFRGHPNEPGRVLHVVEKLAEIRGTTVEAMADLTAENTFRLFGMGDIASTPETITR